MEEELISFDTAKLAKEAGFDVLCLNAYDRVGTPTDYMDRSDIEEYYEMPTQPLLQRWLREKHNLIVQATYNHVSFCSCDIEPMIEVFRINIDEGSCTPLRTNKTNMSAPYEEAIEFGLQEALKLIVE